MNYWWLLPSSPFSVLLLPVLARARQNAWRTVCTSNLKQWGVAITLYAGDHADYFPDNTLPGAHDLGWMAFDFTNSFYPAYLYPNRPGTTTTGQRPLNDVMSCPTDIVHRSVEAANNFPNLIVHHLPFRSNGPGKFLELQCVRSGWLVPEPHQAERVFTVKRQP